MMLQEKLKELRKQSGLTQEQTAEKLSSNCKMGNRKGDS